MEKFQSPSLILAQNLRKEIDEEEEEREREIENNDIRYNTRRTPHLIRA